ncbi:MAG: oligosaccharide repeat unit polymerase [Saprospiraceae bacterium]|nr:oligosaccharide repeat unit polymerase [Saprospiraceae bacterium]
MGAFLISIVILILILYQIFEKELFTPLKMYFAYLIFMCLDIINSDFKAEIYFAYIFMILLGVCFIPFEVVKFRKFKFVTLNWKNSTRPFIFAENRILIAILVLTIIPVSAQLYHINVMGGINGYVLSIPLRVLLWRGLGFLTSLKSFILVINLLFYITLTLFQIKNKKLWITLFIVHLIVTIIILLLTGSRSGVVNLFIYFGLVYHYFRRSINPIIIIISVPLILFIVNAMALLRGGSYLNLLNEGKIFETYEKYKLDSKSHKSTTYSYALYPLSGLYDNEFSNYQYGLTYLTAITNFIPYSYFPSKPSSGGTILTKFMTGRHWTGTSAYSPGLVGEGIINFGYYFGYLAAIIIFFVYSYFPYSFIRGIYKFYIRFNELKLNGLGLILSISGYILSFQILGHAVAGEFTNGIYNILTNLVILLVFYMINKIKV